MCVCMCFSIRVVRFGFPFATKPNRRKKTQTETKKMPTKQAIELTFLALVLNFFSSYFCWLALRIHKRHKSSKTNGTYSRGNFTKHWEEFSFYFLCVCWSLKNKFFILENTWKTSFLPHKNSLGKSHIIHSLNISIWTSNDL